MFTRLRDCVTWARRPKLRPQQREQRRQARRIRMQRRLKRIRPATLMTAGWSGVALGLAELTGAPAVVWPIAAGALVLGLFGYKRLWVILWLGLDALSKVKRESPDDY